MLKTINPQVIFLMETKINSVSMEKVRRVCGFIYSTDVAIEGSKGGLCLAWKGNISVSLRSYSSKHIDVLIEKCDTRSK